MLPDHLQRIRIEAGHLPDELDGLKAPADMLRAKLCIESLRRDLATLVADLDAAILAATESGERVDLGDRSVLVEHLSKVSRTKWRHGDLWDDLVRRVTFDADGTRRDDHVILADVLQLVADCRSNGWRVTGLRDWGVDPEDYCVEDATPSIRVTGGEK